MQNKKMINKKEPKTCKKNYDKSDNNERKCNKKGNVKKDVKEGKK